MEGWFEGHLLHHKIQFILMKDFEFKEEDPKGLRTLEVISKADKFNHWMFNTIQPFCSGKILEIGSGIGNISQFFIESGMNITLSDIRENYCETLKHKYNNVENLNDVLLINLADPEFKNKYERYQNAFDTVFALNVIEHIKDDHYAMKNCRFLLKKNGNLIILVPAYQKLYNTLDVELGHYRRYTKNNLNNLFLINGFEITHSQYFNLTGILGWYLSGKILRKKTISSGFMVLYNGLVPLFKIIDKLTLGSIGLSVIVVGRK